MREWLRQLAPLGIDPVSEAAALRRARAGGTFPPGCATPGARRGEPDFSHAVKEAMDGCLACKSCVGQCPIKVNVPGFRAKFLELYHGRYLRPLRDYLVGSLKTMLPARRQDAAAVQSRDSDSPPGRAAMRALGLVHTPKFSPHRRCGAELAGRGIAIATPRALRALPARSERAASCWCRTRSRAGTRRARARVLDLHAGDRLQAVLAPFRPNGKPLHVHGFLGAFARVACAQRRDAARPGRNRRGAGRRGSVHDADLPVGIRHAARGGPAAARAAAAGVAGAPDAGRDPGGAQAGANTCCCRTARSAPLAYRSLRDWQAAFARRAPACASCRRAAAAWPGPTATRPSTALPPSRSTDELGTPCRRMGAGGRLLATGYSCRSQVEDHGRAGPAPPSAQACWPACAATET